MDNDRVVQASEYKVVEVTVRRFFAGEVNVDRKSAEAIVSVLDLNLEDLIDPKLSDTQDTENDEFDEEDVHDVFDFFGRTQELATLKQWILQDKCRLITLVGMEGIGKTSLAITLKNEIKSEFNRFIYKSLKDFLIA